MWTIAPSSSRVSTVTPENSIWGLVTLFFAGIQKSNDLDVHERHTIEVQCNPRLITFY